MLQEQQERQKIHMVYDKEYILVKIQLVVYYQCCVLIG